MNLAATEKSKYSEIWQAENYTSGTAEKFAGFVKRHVLNKIPFDLITILEIGCGNGTTLKKLNEFSDASGLDITISAAIKNGVDVGLLEMPAWDLDRNKLLYLFDYTVSTDVLEHIPPDMIDQSIRKIMEVSTIGTIHAISTRPAARKYQGHEVHLTVQPLEWWQKQFDSHNEKGIEIILIDSDKLNTL